MGYIAPIHHEQYSQYANRLILREYNYTKLQPVARSYMHSKVFTPHDELPRKAKRQSSKENKVLDKFLTEITGKGQYINELI